MSVDFYSEKPVTNHPIWQVFLIFIISLLKLPETGTLKPIAFFHSNLGYYQTTKKCWVLHVMDIVAWNIGQPEKYVVNNKNTFSFPY